MDPLIADLGKALVGMGPGGMLAAWAVYLWRGERDERREVQAQNVKLIEDTIDSRHQLAAVLEKIAAKVGA